ncbi:NlpC/P60 family protein [Pedobacter polaris]|uniref:NlpC/P60 family protein n=1 Tax=Pedobacter polaris TaxID=2571273 RepID=A0A4U1CLZ3_9SPHI|nr:C40 family peptidase [Pedobacter polaris]TKC08276.1 NlpC/P60 family protein [Pedobacter polaris]
MKKILLILSLLLIFAFNSKAQDNASLPTQYQKMMEKILGNVPKVASSTATQVLDFAKSLIGVPYRYATSNPEKGFDCSGFVSYVFSNFGFKVPRSSSEFASAGVPVKLADAKVGDVLIFTGTNPRVRQIGHVGIIYSIENGDIKFIHSTSGKAHGVTVTEFNDYYKSRFMKAVSIVE